MRTHPHPRRAVAAVAAAGLILVVTASCAMEEYTPPGDRVNPAAQDGTEDVGLLVLSPADGDTVSLPIAVGVQTAVDLGEVEDGLHHIHVWFGEDQEETTTMHFADTAEIADAPEGETTMWVQVADSEHQLVGEPVQIALTVEPADQEDQQDEEGTEDPPDDGAGNDGGYSY